MRPIDLDPLRHQLAELELAAPIAEPPDLRRTGATRAWRLAFIAAIIPLALAGGIILAQIIGPPEVGPTPSPSPSGSPAPSESVEPSPSEAAVATPDPSSTPSSSASAAATPAPPPRWETARVVPSNAGDPEDRQVFFGVEWFEETGWLAYGGQDSRVPALWTSADGRVWELGSMPGGLDDFVVLDVARAEVSGQTRFVAILRGEDDRGAILSSSDGRDWSRATTPDNDTRPMSVTYGHAGFVATAAAPTSEPFRSDGRLWRSNDGSTWTESDPPALERVVAASIEYVDGRYVAAGWPDQTAPPKSVWVSTDAVAWERHDVRPSSGVGALYVASDAGDGAMALLGLTDEPYVLTSVDGISWETDTFDGSYYMTGVDIVGGSIVVVGHMNIADGPADVGIWVWDAGGSAWHAVTWQEHLPDVESSEVENRRAPYVATSPDRTLILLADGFVILTSDRLP